MSQKNLITAAVIVLVLIWVIYRQLRTQEVEYKPILSIILMIVGAQQGLQSVPNLTKNPSALTILLLGSASALIFGYLRARSYKYWTENHKVLRRGNLITLALWIVSFAVKFALSKIDGNAGNFTLFEVGLTLFAQRMIAWNIAKQRFPQEIRLKSEKARQKN